MSDVWYFVIVISSCVGVLNIFCFIMLCFLQIPSGHKWRFYIFGIVSWQYNIIFKAFLYSVIEKLYKSNYFLVGIQIPVMANYTQSQQADLDLISRYRSGFIFFPFDWVGSIPEQFQYSFSAEFPLPFSRIRGRSLFQNLGRVHFIYILKLNWRIFTDKKQGIPISITKVFKSRSAVLMDCTSLVAKVPPKTVNWYFCLSPWFYFLMLIKSFPSGSSFMYHALS